MDTHIVYEINWEGVFYDLEKNEFQKQQMLTKAIPNNIKIHGNVDTYLLALESQVAMLQLQIDPLVRKWFTLTQQINFIEKYKRGEFQNEKVKETNEVTQTEIPTCPENSSGDINDRGNSSDQNQSSKSSS